MKFVRKLVLRPIFRLIKQIVRPFGYVVVLENEMIDYCIHEYQSYEEYRDVQIFHNKRKLNSVWADSVTLKRVANLVVENTKKASIKGICHGTRNGFEQNFFNSLDVGIAAIGTDISDTALDYVDSVQWDFHDVNSDWINNFDFVYTNSLDQSWQPKEALTTWLGQLNHDGVLIVEHTEAHGPKGASEMDPFGVKPSVVPYVLTMWFGSQIAISHSVAKKENTDLDAWLFVISKNVENVNPL